MEANKGKDMMTAEQIKAEILEALEYGDEELDADNCYQEWQIATAMRSSGVADFEMETYGDQHGLDGDGHFFFKAKHVVLTVYHHDDESPLYDEANNEQTITITHII